MKATFITVFTLCYFSTVTPVYSQIIDLGLITRDTNTGLDWLDVTETRNLSFDQVTELIQPGNSLHGWRYATALELDQLISNFGLVPETSSCEFGLTYCYTLSNESDNPIVENIIRTLGDTFDTFLDTTNDERDISPNGAGYVIGFLGTKLIADRQGITGVYDVAIISDKEIISRETGVLINDRFDEVRIAQGALPSDISGPAGGSFLVRHTPIPVPTSFWLLTSSLIATFKLFRKTYD